jgi:hypothetical protein
MVAGVAPIPSSSNAPHNHGPGCMGGRKGMLFAGSEFRTIDEDVDIRGS